MNQNQILLNIFNRLLAESDLNEFSALGGGAITGFSSPVPYIIDKKNRVRKKRRKKLSEIDFNKEM